MAKSKSRESLDKISELSEKAMNVINNGNYNDGQTIEMCRRALSEIKKECG